MNILLKSAKIIDLASPFNQKVKDILLTDGKISRVADKIEKEKGVELFEKKNLHVSPGWLDMHTNLRDPGFEYKEDIESGILAAMAGGFTALACSPNTQPAIHSKSEVEYVKNKAKNKSVDLYPIGAITRELQGKELTEMHDMIKAGAVAFSDGKKSIKNSGMLKIAMQYAKGLNTLLFIYPEDKDLAPSGMVHEGIHSTRTGLSGIPALAEEIMVSRTIELAAHYGANIHFTAISTARSVELIRTAKARGIKVTAGVNAYHLLLDDSHIESFDSNYKVNPPLRTKNDIDALIKGLKDGTIDVINSDHSPEDEESKIVEFDQARFGMIGLETAFGVINTALKEKLSTAEIIQKMAINPRKLLNLPVPSVAEENQASLTLFDPTLKWTFTASDIKSKSKNTPFIGTVFEGKVLGIYNKGLVTF